MASVPKKTIRVNVLFDGRSAQEVADHLREAGLEIEQEFDLLGVVSGRIDPESITKLQDVDGVLSVEEDRDVEALSHQELGKSASDTAPTTG